MYERGKLYIFEMQLVKELGRKTRNQTIHLSPNQPPLHFTLPTNVIDPENKSSILRLPPELVSMIFKYVSSHDLLHTIPSVCQLWHAICLMPILRTRVYLRRHTPAPIFLKTVATRPALRVLHFPAFELAEQVLVDVIKLCPQLQCLNMGFCSLSEEITRTLVDNLPTSLIHLNVEGVTSIEINFIKTLVLKCPKLEALNMSHCISLCDLCVKMVVCHLPHLQGLNLDGVLWLSDDGLLNLVHEESVSPGRMHSLWLDGFELSNAGLMSFFRRLALINQSEPFTGHGNRAGHHLGMQLLWISFCDHMEDGAVQSLSKLSHLVVLTLRKACQVTSNGWSSLFRSADDDILARPSLKWLEHLDLSESSGVTDSVIADICNCCGNRLRSLILNWCWALTDNSVDRIVQVCRSLRQLSLVGNSTIRGHALVCIPINQPNLVVLNMTQCNHICDNILEELTFKIPSLYVFDFFGERVGAHDMNDVCHFDLFRAWGKFPVCSH